MTRTLDDPYAILNIPRNADAETAKKAYRKLARTAHPDRGGDEETFKKITVAYESIRDGKAVANDPFAHAFMNNFFTTPTAKKPSVIRINVPLEFEKALSGGEHTVAFAVPGAHDPSCPKCHGTGKYHDTSSGFPKSVTCDCIGTTPATLTFHAPPNSKDQDLVEETTMIDGTPRLIHIVLSVPDDPRYRKTKKGLSYDLKVSTLELAIGKKARIPFLDGWVTLDIPAGTQPNAHFTVTHERHPGVNIRVLIKAETPQLSLDEQEQLRGLLSNDD